MIGHGIVTGLEFWNHTHTCGTCGCNTSGLPVPMLHPTPATGGAVAIATTAGAARFICTHTHSPTGTLVSPCLPLHMHPVAHWSLVSALIHICVHPPSFVLMSTHLVCCLLTCACTCLITIIYTHSFLHCAHLPSFAIAHPHLSSPAPILICFCMHLPLFVLLQLHPHPCSHALDCNWCHL